MAFWLGFQNKDLVLPCYGRKLVVCGQVGDWAGGGGISNILLPPLSLPPTLPQTGIHFPRTTAVAKRFSASNFASFPTTLRATAKIIFLETNMNKVFIPQLRVLQKLRIAFKSLPDSRQMPDSFHGLTGSSQLCICL